MPPFEVKATSTRSRGDFDPDGRLMQRYEREFEATVYRALQRLRRETERGITDSNVHEMAARLNDPAITRPFQDAIVDGLQAVALAGSDHGRATLERRVFGTAKAIEVGMWELANNAAAAWAIQFGQTLTGMLLMTTTERIQAEVAEYILNSQTIGELIKRIRGGYLYSEERARTIAVTEVTRAFAEGNMASWRASGVIEKKRWRSNNDEIVCPICRPLNGKVVGLDEEFAEGIDAPPGHSRCRCWLTPAIE